MAWFVIEHISIVADQTLKSKSTQHDCRSLQAFKGPFCLMPSIDDLVGQVFPGCYEREEAFDNIMELIQ